MAAQLPGATAGELTVEYAAESPHRQSGSILCRGGKGGQLGQPQPQHLEAQTILQHEGHNERFAGDN